MVLLFNTLQQHTREGRLLTGAQFEVNPVSHIPNRCLIHDEVSLLDLT